MAKYSDRNISLLTEYGIDVPRRTIYLPDRPGTDGTDGIDSVAAVRIFTGLSLIQGPAPINLHIFCSGGDDDSARGIIGAMRADGRKFHGTVFGMAESAASWIFECCHVRNMAPASSLMFHLGDSKKTAHTEYVDKLFVDDVWARMLEKNPEYARSKLMAQVRHDWHVYPTQALELGLADGVIG